MFLNGGFSTLIIAGVVLVLAALLISGKFRVLIKGFLGVFVEDMAKTPEGAKAVYNEAIEKAQTEYNRANNTLQKVAGQLDSARYELEKFKQSLKDVEAKCERFAKAGDFEKAQLFAQEREDVIEEIAARQELVTKLEPMYKDAVLINQSMEQKLTKLKKDQKKVVNDLQLNKQLKQVYDDMDELKNNTHIDKLLDSVKDGVKEGREMAVGAKTVHESKVSTQIERANADDKKAQSSAYIEELKKKYQGK